MSPLHALQVGVAGPRVVFLHGLFGQGRNWSQIAKGLAGEDGTHARCLLLDLPDHGRSSRSQGFDYVRYAEAVADRLRSYAPDEPWTLVGHSLGGKVAMTLALVHPQLVERLTVVDIAPKSYGDLHRFGGYISAMESLPLAELTSRADADERFALSVPDPAVRAFLLQNLRREGRAFSWQVNLPLVSADAARGSGSAIAGFPEAVARLRPYPGPVLWLVGAESEYVVDADSPPMRALFPSVRKVSVKGAGHWVHTDAPEVVVAALRRFLATAQ